MGTIAFSACAGRRPAYILVYVMDPVDCEYVVFNSNYSFLAYVDSNWLIFWFFYLNPDSEIISLVE